MRGRVNVSDIRGALQGHTAHRLPRVAMKESAVAIVVRQTRQGAEVLLIARAVSPEDPWSGHVAFPGGRREPGDANELETAVRETREEIGIDLEKRASLLGQLDEIRASARGRMLDLVIVPFVFELSGEPSVRLSDEVQDVFWTLLDPLASGQSATFHWQRQGSRNLAYPAFRVRDRVVWGLTHRMLVGLLELVSKSVA